MNWKKTLYGLLLTTFALRLSAQIPDGSIAPDFTAQDINGQTHHLYDLLAADKIVVLEISATWCPPCWVYHTSGAMQSLYDAHGPAGDDKLRVLWVEGDPNTTLNCLYGPSGCSAGSEGNYVNGVTFPIFNDHTIANAFQISYFPSIFIICPNKKTYLVDPIGPNELWEKAKTCPVAYGVNNAGIYDYYKGTLLSDICSTQTLQPDFALTNLGSAPLTKASIELKWDNNLVQNIQWEGNLATYAEAPIYFADQPVSGAGQLKATVVSINDGAIDDDFSNNVRNDHFTQSVQFNSTKVLLKLRTDNYSEETYWEVRDNQGNVLFHGGNEWVGPNGGGAFPITTPIGPGSYPMSTIIRDTFDLPAQGCYSIHFADGFGDGMCCNYGSGYFRLYDLDNPTTPLIAGGEFGDYDRRGFGAGILTATASPESADLDLMLFPNPVVEALTIDLEAPDGAMVSGMVLNTLGQVVAQISGERAAPGGYTHTLPMSGQAAGLYILQLNVGGKPITRSFVKQ